MYKEGQPEHVVKHKHIALMQEDLDVLADKLEAAGFVFSQRKSARAEFFCLDPDGNSLEFAEQFILS